MYLIQHILSYLSQSKCRLCNTPRFCAVSYVFLSSFLFVSEAGEAPYITSSGFQFLLLDTASQLWYFTLQYLKTAQVPVYYLLL